ncbi:MAG TPA: hypothetical protein DCM73_12590 [Clostridiales bacterium]|nr:hypothetical protein [Clostridiales bacterium]
MEILLGLIVFFVFIFAAINVGVVLLKVLFTIIGVVIGFSIIMLLIPLGIGLLLIPAVVIGIIVAIVKCLRLIF